MNLTAITFAAFALSSTLAFVHTVTSRTSGLIPSMLRRQSSCIRNMAIRTAISAGTGTAMCGATGAPTMGP